MASASFPENGWTDAWKSYWNKILEKDKGLVDLAST